MAYRLHRTRDSICKYITALFFPWRRPRQRSGLCDPGTGALFTSSPGDRTSFIRPVSSERAEPKEAFSGHTFHVEGLDQAGIIYKVSQYLADNNINIANLNSKLDYSPESGAAYYIMEILIEVLEGASLDNIKQGLDQIADELNVDITFV